MSNLIAEKQAELDLICQRCEMARLTDELTQQFMTMLRLRHGQEFERWLEAIEGARSLNCVVLHTACVKARMLGLLD